VSAEEQRVCRVLDMRGGNILEVEFADKSTTLCMIPAKYRKKIWIRKGAFGIRPLPPSSSS
jgi:translation initiation factor IF-1